MDHRERSLPCLALLLLMCLTLLAWPPFALAERRTFPSPSLTNQRRRGRGRWHARTLGGNAESEADAPVETPEPTRDPSRPCTRQDGSILLTMTFAGDMTIGSNVQSSGTSIFEKELEKQKGDINFPFRNVRDISAGGRPDHGQLRRHAHHRRAATPTRRDYEFLFRADPSYVDMLPAGGVDTVSLRKQPRAAIWATAGLEETKETLLAAGIPYASEGEPAILTVKGVKIGSLAYQTFGGRHDELIAKVPGRYCQALRDAGLRVIVIVSYHWGAEKDYYPNDNQVRLGRATVDAGADLVVGHHSHRINPIEYYNGKYICYSLGNFSFAGNNKPSDMTTFLFQIRMRLRDGEATSEAFKIIPCRISSRTDYNDFTPTPYTKDTHIEAVLRVLKENGRKLEYAVESYPLKFSDEE